MKNYSDAAVLVSLCLVSADVWGRENYSIPEWVIIFYPVMYAIENPHMFVLFLIALFVLVFYVKSLKKKGVIGARALSYDWVCPSCEAVNQAYSEVCLECSRKVT